MITYNVDEAKVVLMPEKMGQPFFIVCAVILLLIIPLALAEPVPDQNSSVELKHDSDSP